MRTMLDETMSDVELRSIDPARKRFRFYAMTASRTLFGELCLVITKGRIGHRLQQRTELFPDEPALLRRRKELFVRRIRNGYLLGSPRISEVSPCTPRPLAKTRGTRAQNSNASLPLFAALNWPN